MRSGLASLLVFVGLTAADARSAELNFVLTDKDTAQPIHNGVVSAQSAGGGTGDAVEQNGSYRVSLAPGSYTVRLKAPGYALQQLQIVVSVDATQPVSMTPT